MVDEFVVVRKRIRAIGRFSVGAGALVVAGHLGELPVIDVSECIRS